MAVFLVRIVGEPTPLDKKQAHTWMISGCSLLERHRTHSIVHLFFSGQSIFQMSPTFRRGLHQRKYLCTSVSAFQFMYLQNFSQSLMIFLERNSFFAALLATRLLSLSLYLKDTHLLASALVQTRFYGQILRRRWSWCLHYTPRHPEGFFTAVEPDLENGSIGVNFLCNCMWSHFDVKLWWLHFFLGR